MGSYKLLVGLGNPGSEYENTRHNIGFMAIDALARQRIARLNYEKENLYLIGQTVVNSEIAILAKPLTYMNRSGAAVADLCRMFEISLRDLVVIVDDFNLPFGKLRVRGKGSDGGHNGLASIIAHLGTSDFVRLRIGIGKDEIEDPVDFVLSPFDKAERKDLKTMLDKCVQACKTFIAEGINNTMNSYN